MQRGAGPLRSPTAGDPAYASGPATYSGGMPMAQHAALYAAYHPSEAVPSNGVTMQASGSNADDMQTTRSNLSISSLLDGPPVRRDGENGGGGAHVHASDAHNADAHDQAGSKASAPKRKRKSEPRPVDVDTEVNSATKGATKRRKSTVTVPPKAALFMNQVPHSLGNGNVRLPERLDLNDAVSDVDDVEDPTCVLPQHAEAAAAYRQSRKQHIQRLDALEAERFHDTSASMLQRLRRIYEPRATVPRRVLDEWYRAAAEAEYEGEEELRRLWDQREREQRDNERRERLELEERERRRRRNERRAAVSANNRAEAAAEAAAAAAAAAAEAGDEFETESRIIGGGPTDRNSDRASDRVGDARGPMSSHLSRVTYEKDNMPELMASDALRAIYNRPYEVTYTAKSQQDLQDVIWLDIARRQVPRVQRIITQSRSIHMSNLRKTMQLTVKEAKRWQFRTNKSIKDQQSKAKRAMREMLVFWKRHEREEREQRRKAERDAQERARREEEERESRRQARKLNFLITQTELYSHFVGSKLGPDYGNESSAGPPATAAPVEGEKDIDFDEDDEQSLHKVAMRNAQQAVAQARATAQTFDSPRADKEGVEYNEGEMNFTNPQMAGDIEVKQPEMLACQLKEYQLKGLNWLANLYEQGINGILADEMGLGKTVQSISVMAYLAEAHNIWGPFLVIAPASTLHNWQQEITRFVPNLRALPYWGSGKDRKILRKFWSRRSLQYSKDSPFHVIVTSYQLVVQDAQYFQRIRWQYMILDEAQAIKSSQSSRWKHLLSFQCRNRLLLTGTPIQNNMQELWALLHFIMPTLFDSHDEFSDWFSKDIESHAQSNTQLNEQQLKRLHMILKPFMLRRVKKNVQSELGEKIEKEVFCELSHRQRTLYRQLRDKISVAEILERVSDGGNDDVASLMNLVMQFRKVCNHPDLFERADVKSPLCLGEWVETASIMRETELNVTYGLRGLIKYRVPRLLYREGGMLDVPSEHTSAGFRGKYLENLLSIWNESHMRQEEDNGFGFLHAASISPSEAWHAFHDSLVDRAFDYSLNRREQSRKALKARALWQDEPKEAEPSQVYLRGLGIGTTDLVATSDDGTGPMAELLSIGKRVVQDERLSRIAPMYDPTVSAPPVDVYSSDRDFVMDQEQALFNALRRKQLQGPNILDENAVLFGKKDPPVLTEPKIPQPDRELAGYSSIRIPSMSRFLSDSGKLARLDKLLAELKAGGHRVLVYFQMTRMIDLMEEYLTYRQYRYLRLDGSSRISERRDMVNDWQTRPELFVFLLSTRAGGLGINLTAADTVIFYDSDWNPTIDSQAADRAHRLGQTKQVTVYRLITRGTIEERILRRAREKEEVQKVVISGGEYKRGDDANAQTGVDFNKGASGSSRDVVSWLLDDDELAMGQQRQQQQQQQQKDASKKRRGGTTGAKKVATAPSLEDMYHEGEGNFDTDATPSGEATPVRRHGGARHRR